MTINEIPYMIQVTDHLYIDAAGTTMIAIIVALSVLGGTVFKEFESDELHKIKEELNMLPLILASNHEIIELLKKAYDSND